MDLKQDSNGDLLLTNGELTFVDGPEEVRQLIDQRLKTHYGEWFLNITIGVPYLQKILIKNSVQASAILKNEILSVPNVLGLNSFALEINKNTREGRCVFDAKASTGNVKGILPV